MIKILTLLGNNYGGCLQAVALQNIIKEYDRNVETINYNEYLNKKLTIKKVIKDIVYFKRNIKFKKFRKKNLLLTKEKNNLKDDGKSKYIVGSDQVWNPTSLPYEIRKNFYLSFVNEKSRKYAYAASIGEDRLDKTAKYEKEIVKMLKQFRSIAVRENSTSKYLNEKYNLHTLTVLDPTMLVGKEFWDSIIKKNYKKKDYILIYTLGMSESCIEEINKFSVKEGKKIIEVFYKKRFKSTLKVENDLGPSEFVSAIANSKIVITNSFHGMVFAIIYHKEFYVLTRNKMNSRIYDLLNTLKLTDRIVKEEEINKINCHSYKKIDYEKVDKIIEEERNKSMNYIKSIVS